MTKFEPKLEDIQRYAESAMSWHGWGSPIGPSLGISALLLSTCGSIYLLHLAGLF